MDSSLPPDGIVRALAEPAGVAMLFALAIWSAAQLMRVWIAANRDVELARVEVQRALAEAIQHQATAALDLTQAQGEMRRIAQEQTIVLRLIAGRVGLSRTETKQQAAAET